MRLASARDFAVARGSAANGPRGFGMAPVGWLIGDDRAPAVLAPTPIMTDQVTYSTDRSRHLMRYATYVRRDPILKDLFAKLKRRAEGRVAG